MISHFYLCIKFNLRRTAIVLLPSLLFIFAGCATNPNSMTASYVSPLIYQNYDCQQLVMESDRISRRVQAMHANLDEKSSGDTTKMTVGLILFWPALFFIDGDEDGAVEYKRLMGESEAIHQAAVARKCDLTLLAPPKPKKVEKEEKVDECATYGNC